MNFAEILGDAAKRSGPPVHVLLLERNDLLFAMPFSASSSGPFPRARFQFASEQFQEGNVTPSDALSAESKHLT